MVADKEKKFSLWLYGLSGILMIANGIFMVYDSFYLLLLPALLLLGYFYLYAYDKIIWLIVLATPLAINVKLKEFGMALSLPTEPLMVGLLMVFIGKVLLERNYFMSLVKHPVLIAIAINLVWILITCFTSIKPIVSLKFFLARLWFLSSGIFLVIPLLKRYEAMIRFTWLYVFSFLIVITYTLYEHRKYGFSQETANWIMSPFYNDHTSYGAILAMFIPVVITFLFLKNKTLTFKALSLITLIILFIALVLSYTRAAWLSLAVALVVYLMYILNLERKYYIIGAVLICIVGIGVSNQMFRKLEKNRQDSSSNLGEHVKSISNIRSDASNLERINRWEAAIRMFQKKPIFGFGPGTYAFAYAPYQFSYQKTIISTNAGDKGNAHSEYIGPLAESGLPGGLTFLGIVVTLLMTSIRVIRDTTDPNHRYLLLACTLGLITYFVHGALNIFLDTDKASVPFWGFAAFIIAADLKRLKKPSDPVEE
jgi:O-antigen ligase